MELVKKKEYVKTTYRMTCRRCQRTYDLETEDIKFEGCKGHKLVWHCPVCLNLANRVSFFDLQLHQVEHYRDME